MVRTFLVQKSVLISRVEKYYGSSLSGHLHLIVVTEWSSLVIDTHLK